MLIGYARTSTLDQTAGFEAQLTELAQAGCEKVFSEQVSSVAPELSPNLGDGLMDQAAAVWDREAAGLAATSIPSVNLTL